MDILLVNPNRILPPIAPIALDYIGSTLQASGHVVSLLDLNFTMNPIQVINRHFSKYKYDLIGVTVRNTEDCYFPGKTNYLPMINRYIQRIKKLSDTPITLGGSGFSVMPEAIMQQMDVEFGICGEGEFAFVKLANGENDIPGLLWKSQNHLNVISPTYGDLSHLPIMRRDLVDNRRYYKYGANVGFETKRGCNSLCTYCVDPLVKGKKIRLRPPAAVVQEIGYLVEKGIYHLHTGDAEFNRPLKHALAICKGIISSGLHKQIKWYAYCAPTPFTNELAEAMQESGCVGVLIGADHTEEHMLNTLGRDFHYEDINNAVEVCRQHNIITYVSLLFGGPGETITSIQHCLKRMRLIHADLIGICLGLRVFPGTPLVKQIQNEGAKLYGPGRHFDDLIQPTFYIPPKLGKDIFKLIHTLAKDDPRILFMDPDAKIFPMVFPWLLTLFVRLGYKGAHWDIIRRLLRIERKVK